MHMNQTSNYQLNQWDAEDRILREDFNRDNEKIDAALAAEAAAREAVAESLKGKLYSLITAIADTGIYDSLSRVSYKIIPWAYTSQQVAVTATFDLVKPNSPC